MGNIFKGTALIILAFVIAIIVLIITWFRHKREQSNEKFGWLVTIIEMLDDVVEFIPLWLALIMAGVLFITGVL